MFERIARRRRRGVIGAHRIHPAGQFQAMLQHERLRSDRSRQPLSLVEIAPGRGDPNPGRTFAVFARVLRKRLRTTDIIGWLDDHRIGAALPDTPEAGAWKVVDDVQALLPPGRTPPHVRVYVYPSDVGDRGEQLDEPAGRPVPGPNGDGLPERSARPMELLFARPLPAWKRALDILGAGLGLVALLPLFAVVAVAIRRSSPGPILFSQWRSGRGGKRFRMYKFRTMVPDAEARKRELTALNEQDGPAFKLRDDPRVTPVGSFLRRTSIDELPQLWNVLRGEMSLVGPRPLPCDESEACQRWQRRRLDVTPGLTCIWQVSGRSLVSFNDWARMDIQYVRSVRLLRDLWILAATVPAVLLRRGAH